MDMIADRLVFVLHKQHSSQIIAIQFYSMVPG